MGEVWKDIPGWEGCYRISDQGNLFPYRKYSIQTVSRNTKIHSVVIHFWETEMNYSQIINKLDFWGGRGLVYILHIIGHGFLCINTCSLHTNCLPTTYHCVY